DQCWAARPSERVFPRRPPGAATGTIPSKPAETAGTRPPERREPLQIWFFDSTTPCALDLTWQSPCEVRGFKDKRSVGPLGGIFHATIRRRTDRMAVETPAGDDARQTTRADGHGPDAAAEVFRTSAMPESSSRANRIESRPGRL